MQGREFNLEDARKRALWRYTGLQRRLPTSNSMKRMLLLVLMMKMVVILVKMMTTKAMMLVFTALG